MAKAFDLLLTRWAMWVLTFIAALPMFYAIVLGLREFQAAYIPVVVDFEVTRFEKLAPDKIEFWGNLTKRFEYVDGLPMCRFAGMQWYIRLPDGSIDQAVWSTLERPLGQIVNRQPGRQPFRAWIVDYRGHPDATETWGVVNHYCLGFWAAETKLGPLKLRAADYLPSASGKS